MVSNIAAAEDADELHREQSINKHELLSISRHSSVTAFSITTEEEEEEAERSRQFHHDDITSSEPETDVSSATGDNNTLCDMETDIVSIQPSSPPRTEDLSSHSSSSSCLTNISSNNDPMGQPVVQIDSQSFTTPFSSDDGGREREEDYRQSGNNNHGIAAADESRGDRHQVTNTVLSDLSYRSRKSLPSLPLLQQPPRTLRKRDNRVLPVSMMMINTTTASAANYASPNEAAVIDEAAIETQKRRTASQLLQQASLSAIATAETSRYRTASVASSVSARSSTLLDELDHDYIPPVNLPGFHAEGDITMDRAVSPTTTQLESQTFRRGRSLFRPERQRSSAKMNKRNRRRRNSNISDQHRADEADKGTCQWWWMLLAHCLTCYAPSRLLSRNQSLRRPDAQSAWREKMALVTLIALGGLFLGFLTFGMNYISCVLRSERRILYRDFNTSVINIRGWLYDISKFQHPVTPGNPIEMFRVAGRDLSWLFPLYPQQLPTGKSACARFETSGQQLNIQCTVDGAPQLRGFCHSLSQYAQMLQTVPIVGQLSYRWSDIEDGDRYIVYNGVVLDLDRYFREGRQLLGDEEFDKILQQSLGGDATRAFTRPGMRRKMDCLLERFRVGVLETQTAACFASEVFTWLSLTIVLGLVLTRFIMALIFNWTTARNWKKALPKIHAADEQLRKQQEQQQQQQQQQLINQQYLQNTGLQTPVATKRQSRFSSQYNTQLRYLSIPRHQQLNPATVAARRSSDSDSHTHRNGGRLLNDHEISRNPNDPRAYISNSPNTMANNSGSKSSSLTQSERKLLQAKGVLRTIMFVACYSEGEQEIRNSLDSLTCTEFPDTHKMLFIVADGLIRGHGNDRMTSELLIDMIRLDPSCRRQPIPYSYVAVADGKRRHNMAQVYCGRYYAGDRSVPAVLVVKCGTPDERQTPKPGNRGKRDSQLILMQFLSKVMFDDRMTPLEFDIFTKMTRVCSSMSSAGGGKRLAVAPDLFELVLMVDADTKVLPDCLQAMSWTMASNPRVMGLCGETRIANKSESWVTAIQVFEYYISHFLSKSFESLFGGVTCLPGCFCMYRIKAPKGQTDLHGGKYYVPILANPDLVEAYSDINTNNLHKRNLLLLGEDRYLSTLMLRQFPKRAMVFVPSAVCRTVAPDRFRVLLSQRRRWINSTFHNLLELLLVRDLCGIFCFSMQFVVFMELLGSALLPSGIIYAVILLIEVFTVRPPPVVTLLLLGCIIILPALLIFLTSGRWAYLLWMWVYLLALPIWNFILPIYAFWNFDDFSWGETRRVQGDDKQGHGGSGVGGRFDSSQIVMKRWAEWEKLRRINEQARVPASASRTKSQRRRRQLFLHHQQQQQQQGQQQQQQQLLASSAAINRQDLSLNDSFDEDGEAVFGSNTTGRRWSNAELRDDSSMMMFEGSDLDDGLPSMRRGSSVELSRFSNQAVAGTWIPRSNLHADDS